MSSSLYYKPVEYWVDSPNVTPAHDPHYYLSYERGGKVHKTKLEALNKDVARIIAEYHIGKHPDGIIRPSGEAQGNSGKST